MSAQPTTNESGLPCIVTSYDCARKTLKSTFLDVVKATSENIHKQRREMGLHDDETDKRRKEIWEITDAKLYAIALVRDGFLASLNACEDLMAEKPSLFILEDIETVHGIVKSLRGRLAMHPLSDRIDSMWHDAENARNICASLLSRISGNAEEQPKSREEAREAKEPLPVPILHEDLVDEVSDFLERIPDFETVDVEALSEACLEELERRGAVVHWSLTEF